MQELTDMHLLLDVIEEEEPDTWSPTLMELGCTPERAIDLGTEVLTSEEALSYARVLLAFGRRFEALDVLGALLHRAQPVAHVA